MLIRSIKVGPKSRIDPQELLRRAAAAKVAAQPFKLEFSPAPVRSLGRVSLPGELAAARPAMRFIVDGNPIPWERVMLDSRRMKKKARAMFITAKRTRQHQEKIKGAARRAGVTPLDGPVKLVMTFFRATAQRCDVDNLSKSVQDALNGIAYADDSQIVALVAVKLIDREDPRTEVVVSLAGERAAPPPRPAPNLEDDPAYQPNLGAHATQDGDPA